MHTQPGEKGVGRTLLTLALNNQDKPNAVDNTDIIIAYDGDERTSNLQIAPIQTRLPLPPTLYYPERGLTEPIVNSWNLGSFSFFSSCSSFLPLLTERQLVCPHLFSFSGYCYSPAFLGAPAPEPDTRDRSTGTYRPVSKN